MLYEIKETPIEKKFKHNLNSNLPTKTYGILGVDIETALKNIPNDTEQSQSYKIRIYEMIMNIS